MAVCSLFQAEHNLRASAQHPDLPGARRPAGQEAGLDTSGLSSSALVPSSQGGGVALGCGGSLVPSCALWVSFLLSSAFLPLWDLQAHQGLFLFCYHEVSGKPPRTLPRTGQLQVSTCSHGLVPATGTKGCGTEMLVSGHGFAAEPTTCSLHPGGRSCVCCGNPEDGNRLRPDGSRPSHATS